MNKTDLQDYVYSLNDDLSKAKVAKVIDDALDGVKKGILEDGSTVLVGTGSFTVVERAARKGRHPQTGAEMQIAASKNVKFKAGKDLKDALNDKK